MQQQRHVHTLHCGYWPAYTVLPASVQIGRRAAWQAKPFLKALCGTVLELVTHTQWLLHLIL